MSGIKETPNTASAIYKAAVLIDREGPQSRDALFQQVDFGAPAARNEKLRHAFDIDWLYETPAGQIDVTESTLQHFDRKKPNGYVGEIVPATYRPNIFASQGLSKKYIPNRRGTRADVPAWAVRDGLSFQKKA